MHGYKCQPRLAELSSPHNTRWRARRSGRRGGADTVDLPFGARVRVPAPHQAQPHAAHHPGPGRDPGPLPRGVPAPWRVANTWGAGRGLWGAPRVGTLWLTPWLEQRDSRFAGNVTRASRANERLGVASSNRECRPRDRHSPVAQCERGKMAQARTAYAGIDPPTMIVYTIFSGTCDFLESVASSYFLNYLIQKKA